MLFFPGIPDSGNPVRRGKIFVDCVDHKSTMRIDMKIMLKREFRTIALRTRDRHHLTQYGMADALCMSLNSYSESETSGI